MELLEKQGAQLAPKDTAEAVAIFRAQVIGPLLTRVFTSHGELASAIAALARVQHRPPHGSTTRTYSKATIERWYYRFKKHGLSGITPHRRSDSGHARELTDAQRELLLAIRREHPTTSAALILRTLELDGRLAKSAVSLSTLRRLYGQHGLDRVALRVADGRVRLRWKADRVDALWHADVCHGPAMKIGGRTCRCASTRCSTTTAATSSRSWPRRPSARSRCCRCSSKPCAARAAVPRRSISTTVRRTRATCSPRRARA